MIIFNILFCLFMGIALIDVSVMGIALGYTVFKDDSDLAENILFGGFVVFFIDFPFMLVSGIVMQNYGGSF